MKTAVADRIAELTGARVPFVHATVVRAEHPTSARPGNDAIVLGDGSIEGFVGGVCAEGSVVSASLSALSDGRAVLLRVLPSDAATFPDVPGAVVATNPCLSGGALEIFLRPQIPPPLLAISGATPIAESLASVAAAAGFAVDRLAGDRPPSAGTFAVVVAGLGRDETVPLRTALDSGVGYVGLVASSKRGRALLGELALTDAERARVHTPAGLDIGADTPGEIAVSVLADLIRAMRRDNLRPASARASGSGPAPAIPGGSEPAAEVQGDATGDAATPGGPALALDPVCGMTVVVRADTPHLEVDGTEFWFCATGCRDAYAAQVAG